VAIPDDVVTVVRSMLADTPDPVELARLVHDLEQDGKGTAFLHLFYATFAVAARRRFSPTWSPAQVVGYVAEVRSSLPEMAEILDAVLAEHELRLALGQELPLPSASWEIRLLTELILLVPLTGDYTEHEIDTLIAEARAMTDQ
jgi:hypothetical protein